MDSTKLNNKVKIGGSFTIVCRDKNGKIKWQDTAKNLVTNAGLNSLLDVYLHGASQITTWYVGLTDGTPSPAAADTMSSHAGWSEVEDYDEANRVEFNEAAASSQSITNSANKAEFTIDTNSTTIGGAFLTSVNTKGGSTGTLFCVAAFAAGDKSADDDDTLQVTYTIGAADA